MKILHIGLLSHFTDKMLYQENLLCDLNVKAGHEVTFISDTYEYRNGILVETEECDIILENGVRLIRVKYDKVINQFITRKIQKAKKVFYYLNTIKPDTILYHGVCGYELVDVANYVKKRGIPFYIDSHENFKNTAKFFVSRLAYKYIHGVFVRKALPLASKILFIGYAEREYLKKMYHLSDTVLEYFPLGGILIEKEEQEKYRKKLISEMGLPKNVIICAHSGKMDKGKKTREVLEAFLSVKDKHLCLLIFGSIPDDMKEFLIPLINNDDRVYFLGWLNAEEQERILAASDLYIQPGTYSATAQIAICSGCALIANRGYISSMGKAPFYEEDVEGIKKVFLEILSDKNLLIKRKQDCFKLAAERFDYKKLAERYLI